ncbi:MAG: serine hydrolase, partial [Bacteroidetes bacterium]
MKKIIKYILVFLFLGVVYLVYSNYPRLNIVTGFASKSVASGVFLANRTQESVEKGDNDFSPISKAKNKVNLSERSVTSNIYGLKKRKAIYVDGLGAILVNGNFDPKKQFDIPYRNKAPKNLPFPYGVLPQIDNEFVNIDYQVLNEAVNNAFDKGDE